MRFPEDIPRNHELAHHGRLRKTTAYHVYLSLGKKRQDEIARSIIMSNLQDVSLVYGFMEAYAVARYHPDIKHRYPWAGPWYKQVRDDQGPDNNYGGPY
jgi:hypothetical protein